MSIFAPVVDLNRHVINQADRFTRIHERAIAADPQVVTEVARQYCAALWETGVHCTLKHFPGLGRVFEDTHRQSADLTTPLGDLTAADWIPFRTLMADAGTLTMLGHARLTAVDHERPASFSRRVVAGLLRQQWRQSGILVTDDFFMAAVYDHGGGIGAAAVAALNAEVDLILVSFDPDQYYPLMYALLRAERDGKLRQDALRQSEDRLRGAWPAGTAE
jgi:beta-N-acetylhexosaminidase